MGAEPKRKSKKSKCECAYQYCCDHCWRLTAEDDPCKVDGCENPHGHVGPHGPLSNTQTIRLTADDFR